MRNYNQTNKGSWNTCAYKLFILLQTLFISAIVTAQPVITSFEPRSGNAGTSIIITGSGFSSSLSGNVVFFGGVKATVSAASSSTLTVVVPKGATSKPITVTSGKLTAYAAVPFRVTFKGGDTAFLPGSFAPKVSFRVDKSGSTVWYYAYLTDLDGDGKLDVFSANNSDRSTTAVLRNLSQPGNILFGELTNFPSNGRPHGGAVGDFDGDGKPDVAIGTENPYKVSIFKNTSDPGAITFASRMDIPGSNSPRSIACADIDGDGRPDLVAVSFNIGVVSVLKNTTVNDVISFNTRKDFIIGGYSINLVIGDVDGDGRPDIVTTNTGSDSLSILRNTTINGEISFAPKVDLLTGIFPRVTALGDLDDDGRLDLVTSNAEANTISIYRNLSSPGTIAFAERKDIETPLAPYGIALEDLDGDGDLDIAEVNVNAYTVSILKNISVPGSILLSPKADYSVSERPYFIEIGDLDGDGKADLTVSIERQGNIEMLRNKTNEPIITSISPTIGYNGTTVNITGFNFSGATGVTIGGIPVSSFTLLSPTTIEAVVSTGATGNVLVTTSNGTATISGFVYMPPPKINNFTPQVASNGATIMILGDHLSGTKSVSFGGVPARSFKVLSPTTVSAIVSEGATGNVTVQNETGVTSFPGFRYVSPPVIKEISPSAAPVGAQVTIKGDHFDNISGGKTVYFGGVKATIKVSSNTSLTVIVPDGCTNMPVSVTSNFLTGYSYTSFTPIYPGAGANLVSHSFAPKTDFTAGNNPTGVAMSDFDGDGNPDLATSNSSAYLSVYKNTGIKGSAAFSAKKDYFAGNATASVYAGDLDGDGKQDIVTTSPLSQTISTFRNISTPGNINFSNAQFIYAYISGDQVSDVSIGDIDVDGKPDLVVANSNPHTISVYRNISLPGQITFEAKVDLIVLSGNKSFVISDLNLDGKPEIAIAVTNAGVITIYKNLSTPGTISLSQNSPSAVRGSGSGISAGDFDGDGRPDLAVNNYHPLQPQFSAVSIFKNIGSGDEISFDRAMEIPIGGALGDIVAADVDGDSRTDLAIVNSENNAISILKNKGTGGISFAARYDYATGVNPQGLAFGDFDKDGKADMAVCSQNIAAFSVLRNTIGEPVVLPSGANPVSGIITHKLRIDSSVQVSNGVPYVRRNYEIEPQTNPLTATATITLFFTQEDFDHFNAFPFHGPNLPSSPTDDAGKAALRIFQYHGFSATGMPADYQGAAVEINPDDSAIKWNAIPQWWEVTFSVAGFSGFFAGTQGNSVLPMNLLGFIATKEGDNNLVQWITSGESNMAYFEIQKSNNGLLYDSLFVVRALNTPIVQRYQHKDISAAESVSYYRLKMVDRNGLVTFSKVVIVESMSNAASFRAYPNPAEDEALIEHPLGRTGARLQIIDLTGKVIRTFKVSPNTGSTRIVTRGLSSGIYNVIWSDAGKMLIHRILVK